jgi:hypothetical protein
MEFLHKVFLQSYKPTGAKARHYLFRLRHDSSRALTLLAALLESFFVREAAPFQEKAIDRIQIFVTPGTL